MKISRTIMVGAIGLAFSSAVFAQSTRVDRAFTATGESCDQVTWSEESLERYPQIASACRGVLERDGSYFVQFEGRVERVANRGEEVTIDFRGGDRLTLTPPENMTIYMDGKRSTAADLRPGDRLNFYIPQSQLVATFFAGEPETAPAQEAPISEESEEQVAATAPPPSRNALPGTASSLPMLAVGGLMLLAFGGMLTIRRRFGSR